MHPKKKNSVYVDLFNLLNSRIKKHGYEVTTEFDGNKQEFIIENIVIKTGEVIYHKQFGYHKETQKDALIARACEEYLMDMLEYGILLNYESFITTTK